MSGAADERQRLFTEIARCPLVQLNVESERGTHPCRAVVTHQWPRIPVDDRRERWKREHHIPEPWVGHLGIAPLLFLSSNPFIGSLRSKEAPRPNEFAKPIKRLGEHARREHRAFRHGLSAPKPRWEDDEIFDRFENGLSVWAADGTRPILDEEGTPGERVPFWAAAREIADALFAPEAVEPGVHYALTEVVHCKSRGEVGVSNAVKVCSALYLRRVLAMSPARLVVVFGDHARNAVRETFSYSDPGTITAPIRIGRRARRFAFLAHPANRQSEPRYPRRLEDSDLVVARRVLDR